MLTDQDIFQRYQTKIHQFNQSAEVTLIGHSLFDMWDDLPDGTPTLAGKTVANLGISGVSTRQYLDVIIKPKRIPHLGDDVFLFLGVNDIVKEPDYSPKQVLDWLIEIWQKLQEIAPHSRYYLLEPTPVNNRGNVSNEQIWALNDYLESHCPQGLGYLKTQSAFADEKGDLANAYHTDGLHFSAKGYAVLTRLLTEKLA